MTSLTRLHRSLAVLAALAAIALAAPPVAEAQTRLLRFPAIHGDRVAFTYAGDIWVAPVTGGTATRLTAHPGMEVFARFSPDGKWIAFTGQYDGDEQVYVMPSTGGEPKQLTFYPARGPLTPRWGWDNHVYGWTADGKGILFRSMRDAWTLGLNRLYTVPMAGGPAEALPMPESGAGDYSPDGTRVVYSPLFRDFRPEKRYGGGMANDLFIFDLATHDARRIVDHARSDRDPMWIGNAIYFTSDRNGTFNIYAYDVASGRVTPVTTSRTWDVRWPSSDKQGRIVYELNGELQVLDVKSGRSTAVAITVPDDGAWKRPSRVSAAGQIEDFELSPKGERALFTARGDVFTLPVEKGPTRNLTTSSGAHDKWARWSPDGSRIAFISDRSGEEELYVVAQDGTGKAEALTSGGTAMRYAAGVGARRQAHRVQRQGRESARLLVRRRRRSPRSSTRRTARCATTRGRRAATTWRSACGAPTGSARSTSGARGDGQLRTITDEMFNAENPAWDPDGDYLFYLSDRDYAPQISSVEFNYATNRTTGIFALALRKDVKHPFPPESDEVSVTKADEPPAAPKPVAAAAASTSPDAARTDTPKPADKPAAGATAATLAIDFDGLGAARGPCAPRRPTTTAA